MRLGPLTEPRLPWVRGWPGGGEDREPTSSCAGPRRQPRAWPCGSVVEGPGLHSVNPTSAHRMQEASSRPWPIGWAVVTWAVMSRPLRGACGCLSLLGGRVGGAGGEKERKKKGKRERKVMAFICGAGLSTRPRNRTESSWRGGGGAVVWILGEAPLE